MAPGDNEFDTPALEPVLGDFTMGLARQRTGWDWAKFMTIAVDC